MSLTLKAQNKGTTLEAGTHTARLVWIVDLGIQETNYGPKSQVALTWEFPEELLEDGQPMVSTARINDPTLDLSNGIDLPSLLGKECQVQIKHTPAKKGDRVYANVVHTMPLAKGQAVKPAHNELKSFDFDNPDPEVFHTLPQFLQELVRGAKNFAASMVLGAESGYPQHEDENEEDLPF